MFQEPQIIPNDYLQSLCERFPIHNTINPQAYAKYHVKRGLRNEDGTGVLAGLTLIGNVHGYIIADNEKVPDEGRLTYRGYDVRDIVESCEKAGRHGFEETIYLLLFSELPNKQQLDEFTSILSKCRELPEGFTQDMIIRAPSKNIMNKLARTTLALYSYDENPDDNSLANVLRQCIQLIARFPLLATYSYQVKRHIFDKESLYIHFADETMSTAENILHTFRPDKKFTKEEAKLLDLALILHAEHGGGNNSTFTSRVLASSATDTYAAMSSAVSSLKGSKHGGANIKVVEMMDDIKANVKDWEDDDELTAYLQKILNKEVNDHSGLIYGMGHAIYTKSDPRAVLLKQNAKMLASQKNMQKEYNLIESVARLSPSLLNEKTGTERTICSNVDMYSGFVYQMLGIPTELYTPLFAIARVAGWSAHIIEEFMLGNRIIRPAYKSIVPHKAYIPLDERK